jgi:hypothetical protein
MATEVMNIKCHVSATTIQYFIIASFRTSLIYSQLHATQLEELPITIGHMGA